MTRALIRIVVLAMVLAGALIIYGLIEAKADPIRREAEIVAPAFPSGQKPFRVALLSDIHFGNRAMQRDRLEAIVAAVNASKPDLIVIVGDFVNGHRGDLETDLGELGGQLSALKAPYGVIATPGNHDHWTDNTKVSTALEQAGIVVLANAPAQRGPLLILGLDDNFTHHDDVAATFAAAKGMAGLPVVVTHSPDLAPRLPTGIGTVLAGHTHCGQVVLPVIGSLAPVFGYHVYDPRYQCGQVRDGKRTVIVTAGLGSGSIPFRVGAPPDWWLVTFRAPLSAPMDR